MSNFDPITFSAVNKLKAPVGSLMMVPEGFTSNKFLDTGANFNAVDYPDLAEVFPTSTSADITVTEVQVPYNPSSLEALAIKLGPVVHVCALDSNPNAYYIIFGSGKVYVSNNEETPVFYKQITTPTGAQAVITVSTAINWGNFSPIVNNRIYVGGVAGGSTHPTSGVAAETYYIDLANDFATVAVNLPKHASGAYAFGWKSQHTCWRAGQYITLGNPINTGGTAQAQLSVCTSSDGVNFSVVSTYATIGASSVTGFAVSPSAAVVVTNATTVHRSVDLLTWTTSTANSAINTVAFNPTNNLFIGAGVAVGSVLFSSIDGSSWTARTQGAVACTTPIVKLLVNGADTIAVAGTSANALQTQHSTNGTTWTRKDTIIGLNNKNWSGSLFCTNMSAAANNFLVSVGTFQNNDLSHYQTQKLLVTSYNLGMDPNSIKYINTSNVTCNSLTAPVFLADGLTGCVIENAQSFPIYVNSISGYATSDGGVNWSPFVYKLDGLSPADKKLATVFSTKLVANDNKFYLGISTSVSSSSCQFLKSSNGLNWALSQVSSMSTVPTSGSLTGFKNILYIFANNLLMSVNEGNTWTTVPGVSYNPNTQVLLSSKQGLSIIDIANTTYMSDDGINWRQYPYMISGATQSTSAASNDERAITLNNNSSTLLYEVKPNEITCKTINTPTNKNLILQLVQNCIVLHNTAGMALVSSDNGVSWSTVKLLNNNKFSAISSSNSWCVSGAVLYKLGVNTSMKKVPRVISTVPGSKWVIRSKK